jgi:endonuclease YncB( thermonuclease family)
LPWPLVFDKFTGVSLRSSGKSYGRGIGAKTVGDTIAVFGHEIKNWFTVAILLLLAAPVSAEDYSGRVVDISDGDTISVLHDRRAEKIRLNGIDAPEKGQPFSNRAKQFVSELAFGKEVKVEAKGQDRYGRTIGDVFLPDGRNLNHEIVQAGFAWWFRKYAPNDKALERIESEAPGSQTRLVGR